METHYNILYNEDFTKKYLACRKNCEICEIWKKPNNIWKFFEFFPYHCFSCCHAGFPDDFYLFNERVFLCKNCYVKTKKKLNNHIFKKYI